MSRWRKVEVKAWLDDDIRSMSAPAPNGQTLWFYLLTGPRTISIPGVVVAREAVLADDLGWSIEGFREAYAEAFAKGLVKADWKAGLVVIRKALLDGSGEPRDSNKPESPNVLKSWAKSWDDIPECDLKTELLQTLGSFAKALGEGYTEAFGKAFGKALAKAYRKPSPNQEQEKEQDQEKDQEPGERELRAGAPAIPVPPAPEPAAPAAGPPPEPPRHRLFEHGGPPDPDPLGTERKRILAVIAPLHVEVFNRTRADLESQVPPMQLVGDPAERRLRELLLELRYLDGVEEACRHVLAVREAEARAMGSVKFLGASVWSSAAFSRARSMTLDEARDGNSRAPPAAARGRPSSGFDALLAASTDDDDRPGDST